MTNSSSKSDDGIQVNTPTKQGGLPLFSDPDRREEAERARKAGRKGRVGSVLPTTLEGIIKARSSLYRATLKGKVSNPLAIVRMKLLDAQERSLRAPLTAQVLELKRQLADLKKAMVKP